MKTQPKTEPEGPPFDRHEDPNANSRDRFDYYSVPRPNPTTTKETK